MSASEPDIRDYWTVAADTKVRHMSQDVYCCILQILYAMPQNRALGVNRDCAAYIFAFIPRFSSTSHVFTSPFIPQCVLPAPLPPLAYSSLVLARALGTGALGVVWEAFVAEQQRSRYVV